MDTLDRNDVSKYLRKNESVGDLVPDTGNLSIEQYDRRAKTEVAVPEPISQREDSTFRVIILGEANIRDSPRDGFKSHPTRLIRHRNVIITFDTRIHVSQLNVPGYSPVPIGANEIGNCSRHFCLSGSVDSKF
jgi:hypothetical protein